MKKLIDQINVELDQASTEGDRWLLATRLLQERPELGDLFRILMEMEPEKQSEAVEICQAMLEPRNGSVA